MPGPRFPSQLELMQQSIGRTVRLVSLAGPDPVLRPGAIGEVIDVTEGAPSLGIGPRYVVAWSTGHELQVNEGDVIEFLDPPTH